MNNFSVSYVTTLPKEGNVPKVTITGDQPQTYKIKVFDGLDDFDGLDKLVMTGECKTNQICVFKGQQWLTNWLVKVYDENDSVVFVDKFNPNEKTIFIKIDAYALGDNIAWVPYVEAFRKKYNATVICSTFFNYLFAEAYPKILFVKPNTVIDNVYAQCYIGAANDENKKYSLITVNKSPLQLAAASVLGVGYKEIQPDIRGKYKYLKPRTTEKYVTLSEFGSAPEKGWRCPDGWQRVVDYIRYKGYEVLVISKEPTQLQNVVNLTGNFSLDERAVDIMNAKLHLGVSSGLSWLAWALHTPVMMISDVTPNWHEFTTGITRLNCNELDEVNYSSEGYTSIEEVIDKLSDLLV